MCPMWGRANVPAQRITSRFPVNRSLSNTSSCQGRHDVSRCAPGGVVAKLLRSWEAVNCGVRFLLGKRADRIPVSPALPVHGEDGRRDRP